MHRITSAQFKAAVNHDPAWASKLTKPMKITDRCDMEGSEITHLSPLLHFGKDDTGYSATFSNCKSLKIVEGKFEGFVYFYSSAIEKIGDLTCGKNNIGDSAFFDGCKSLKIAEGKFGGFVDFSYSSIEKIGDLSCEKNERGIRLDLRECPNLTKIPITFNPSEVKADAELLEKLEVDRFIQKKRSKIVEIEI